MFKIRADLDGFNLTEYVHYMNQACAFCSTGRMGLLRNLALDEILIQVRSA